jgi:hypothetical protein
MVGVIKGRGGERGRRMIPEVAAHVGVYVKCAAAGGVRAAEGWDACVSMGGNEMK